MRAGDSAKRYVVMSPHGCIAMWHAVRGCNCAIRQLGSVPDSHVLAGRAKRSEVPRLQ